MLDAWKNHNSLEYKAPYFTSEMRREAGGEGEKLTNARGKQLAYHRPLRTEISMCVRLEWNEETAQKRKLFKKRYIKHQKECFIWYPEHLEVICMCNDEMVTSEIRE